MDIGKIIKEERTKRNLTQEQLAQEFFVTRQLISKWENGKSYPDLDQVVKLSSYFELTLDYLLKEDQQMVQELNLTTHRKRIGLVLIALLTILSISLSTILLAAFWIDPVFFTKEDLTITSIKKYRLPATEITNEATGQVIQLPEDTEYLITYTIDRKCQPINGFGSSRFSFWRANKQNRHSQQSRRQFSCTRIKCRQGSLSS